MHVIDERQQAMLEFEHNFWTFDEPKESLIRARFQCSADEYYAELNDLLELPAAMDHDPLVVRRLRRQRVRRRRERLDTGTDAGITYIGMDGIGKVDRRRTDRQFDNPAFRREDIKFIWEQIGLNVFDKLE